jgi:hypothetical protein
MSSGHDAYCWSMLPTAKRLTTDTCVNHELFIVVDEHLKRSTAHVLLTHWRSLRDQLANDHLMCVTDKCPRENYTLRLGSVWTTTCVYGVTPAAGRCTCAHPTRLQRQGVRQRSRHNCPSTIVDKCRCAARTGHRAVSCDHVSNVCTHSTFSVPVSLYRAVSCATISPNV